MKRGWKILGSVLAAIALVIGLGVIWISIVADRRGAAMEKEIAALREQVEKRVHPRAPLRGEPLEGNAWEDYNQAFGALPDVDRESVRSIYKGKKVLFPDKHAELIASAQASFDHLRRGTRRRFGAFPFVWQDGVTVKTPASADCQTLAYLAAFRSRALLEKGRPREAAELMLDLLRFTEDLGSNAPIMLFWNSYVLRTVGLDELRTLLGSKALDREDLLAIERELEQLAKALPGFGDGADAEVLLSGYELLKPRAERAVELCATFSDSWKFAFSRRIAELDAFDQALLLAKKFPDLTRLPWKEAIGLSAELEQSTHENGNQLVPQVLAWTRNRSEADWEKKAHFGFLRIAARFRATGEVLSLDDPFGGGSLRTERTGDRLKIWSVGLNHVDDGGIGAWPRGEGKDMVLEVSR